jgi:hypothetical protein
MTEENREQRSARISREVGIDPYIFDINKWRRISANGIEPQTSWLEDPVDPRPGEVELCRQWIRLFAIPTKGMGRGGLTSYGYKHHVEDWTARTGDPYTQTDFHDRRWTGSYHYVSNGEFIAAAIAEGYRAVRDGRGSINAVFDFTVPRAHGVIEARKAAKAQEMAAALRSIVASYSPAEAHEPHLSRYLLNLIRRAERHELAAQRWAHLAKAKREEQAREQEALRLQHWRKATR